MPALNSMVNHDILLNSGLSSGLPSLILPYFEKLITSTNTMKAAITTMYHQPNVDTIQSWVDDNTVPAASGAKIPNRANALTRTNDGQNTAGAIIPRLRRTPWAFSFPATRMSESASWTRCSSGKSFISALVRSTVDSCGSASVLSVSGGSAPGRPSFEGSDGEELMINLPLTIFASSLP